MYNFQLKHQTVQTKRKAKQNANTMYMNDVLHANLYIVYI